MALIKLGCLVFFTIVTTSFGAFDGGGCVDNCVKLPDMCTEKCEAQVTYTGYQKKFIKFETKGVPGKYTAVALSLDKMMKDSFAAACVEKDGNIKLHRLWLIGYEGAEEILDSEAPDHQLDNPTKKTTDGIVMCSFGLKLPIKFKNIVFDGNKDIYILLATGNVDDTTPFISYHEDKKPSSAPIVWNMTTTLNDTSATTPDGNKTTVSTTASTTSSTTLTTTATTTFTSTASGPQGPNKPYIQHTLTSVLVILIILASNIIIFV